MTGIERLRELADKYAELGKDHTTIDVVPSGMAMLFSSIANQIERERACDGDTAENIRLIVGGVIDEMERHVLGHEGMEDSPVARWARELRAALGGRDEEVTDVATIRKDAYDAYEWVEAHGGLDAVKEEWRSRVPYDKHEERRQRLINHIAECEEALGRRNERIKELGRRVNDLTTENAELHRRAMPEGCEWPRFEDGEPVRIGDKFECWCGDTEVVGSVTIMEGRSVLNRSQPHAFIVSDGPFTAHGERVKRPAPKVLDADGAEIRVGDIVYLLPGDWCGKFPLLGCHEWDAMKVISLSYNHDTGRIECGTTSSYVVCRPYPSQLTHRAPVIAADGRPLRDGEHVYHVETGAELVVKELPKPGEYQAVVVFAPPASHLTSFDPDQLTHERPDTRAQVIDGMDEETVERIDRLVKDGRWLDD